MTLDDLAKSFLVGILIMLILNTIEIAKPFGITIARVEFEPRDLWFGIYWNREKAALLSAFDLSLICYNCQFDLYIGIVPMLPIHFRQEWQE